MVYTRAANAVFIPAIGVSLLDIDYNATEGTDTSVEVCVEIVMGTVNQVAAVEVMTISGSATGKI